MTIECPSTTENSHGVINEVINNNQTKETMVSALKKPTTSVEFCKMISLDSIIGKKTINNRDSLFIGSMLLDRLPDNLSRIDSHGIAKDDQIGNLLNIINNGIDKNREIYTAPLVVSSENKSGVGAALGTSGGHSTRDGLFILCSDKDKKLEDGICTILINDMTNDNSEEKLQYETAIKIRDKLSELYPDIDFVLYSDAKNYFFKKYG